MSRTQSPGETAALGRRYAARLAPGDVVGLIGELGSGKTQFIAGVCSGLGVTARVTSPTFTLVNEYPAPFGTVVHVDLYRIAGRPELAEVGVEEYFNPRTICLIEWADRVAGLLPAGSKMVRIRQTGSSDEREFMFDEER